MPSTREKLTGALYWTFVPRTVQLLVSLFTSILIVRTLSDFDFGTLKVLQGILSVFVLLISFGLGQALNRYVPELRVSARPGQSRALLYRCVALQSSIWLVLIAAMLLLQGSLVERFPTYAHLLILGVLLAILEVAAGTFNQYAVASYRTREMAAGVTVGYVVVALATAVLLYVGLRVEGVLIALGAGHLVNSITLLALLRGEGSWTDAGRAERSRFPWRRLLSYAVPWIPNNLLNFVVWRSSETILLGIFRPRQEAGYFDRAYQIPQMALEFIPNSVYSLVLAGFSETANVAKERMPEFLSFYYRLLFFVLAPVSLLGFALGDRILLAMYGMKMAAAGPYCQAFFLIFTISFFGTPLSMAVYVMEKVWVNLLVNLGYAAVTLALDLLLIPRYGLLGATLPTAFVTALTPFVRYAIARRYLAAIHIPWAFILRAYLASAPLLGLFWAKQRVMTAFQLLVLCVLAGIVTLISYRLFRVLGSEEREFIRRSRLPAKEWLLRLL